jgi:hypothetical protein
MAEAEWKCDGISYTFTANRAILLMFPWVLPFPEDSHAAALQVRNQTRSSKTVFAIASAGEWPSRLAMSAGCDSLRVRRSVCSYF